MSKKRRRRKKSNNYFGEREEQAVIEYNNTECAARKNEIYNTILKEPFRIMVEAISKRYPIYLGEHTIEDVQMYALSHLIENMVIYNPNKKLKSGNKPKAYSYCQTIVRNFYRQHSREEYKKLKTDVNYDMFSEDIENTYTYELEEDVDEYILLADIMVDKMIEMLDTNTTLSDNEIIVGEAIVNVLKNWQILFLEEDATSKFFKRTSKKYTKSKVLLLLKEQTRMTTKEIRNNMKPFSMIYFDEKDDILDVK